MNLLLDFRAFQEFYPRGVSRFCYELFSEIIRQNKGESSILLNKEKIKPNFNSETLSKISNNYDINDFQNVRKKFDFYIGGSACWLNMSPTNVLDKMYPEFILDKCNFKTVILHDFVPMLYHHYLPTKKDQLSYIIQTEYLKKFDCLLTNSLYTIKCAIKYLNIPRTKLICIYGGADTKKFTSKNSGKEYRENLRNLDLVAVLGGCPRKNVLGLAKAFALALTEKEIPPKASLKLLSCEAFSKEVEQIIKESTLDKKHLQILEYLTDSSMLNLITNARATIFPSFYEGLGLPILESYTAGTPCFASNVSSTKELVNPEASFDPFNLESIKKAIIKIYSDENTLKTNLAFGRELIKKLNWKNSASLTLTGLEKIKLQKA